jgi:hypothetical protein
MAAAAGTLRDFGHRAERICSRRCSILTWPAGRVNGASHVRASLQRQVRLALAQQEGRQHRLQDQGRTAGGADAKSIVARLDPTGAK